MILEPNQIYHIYNRGNNKQVIFPEERNYIFFMNKMRKELLPYCSFLAYCLMPNHFHWLVYMKPEGSEWFIKEKDGITTHKSQYFHKHLGKFLSSYTRAINNQENRIGTLFQQHTKIEDGWNTDRLITIDQSSTFVKFNDGIEYARVCMNYIHQNPVKANLARKAENWLYSSASDYAGLRNGSLCNQKLAHDLNILTS